MEATASRARPTRLDGLLEARRAAARYVGATDAASDLDRGDDGALDAVALVGSGVERTRLPVHRYRQALLALVERYPVVVVVGHTGCGKTTRTSTRSHRNPPVFA